MLNKFSDLLSHDYSWEVMFDNQSYSRLQVANLINDLIISLESNGANFDPSKYIICMGMNSFHFFVYTLLASVLNLKCIFVTPQQLIDFSDKYKKLPIQFIFTPRKIRCELAPILLLKLSDYTSEQKFWEKEGKLPNKNQANIVFNTSGITGSQKFIVYNEKNLLENANIVGDYLEVKQSDVCLCIFPVNYMYGFSMLFSMLIKNAKVILERSTLPSYAILDYLENYQVTFLPILRTIVEEIYPLIKKLNRYYPNLTVLNASDKIYKCHVEDILNFAPVFWNNFGQTESGPRLFALKIEN